MTEQGDDFTGEARATFSNARTLFQTWHDRWQADSGRGYSDTDEALVDVDRLLQELESVRTRWRELDAPPTQTTRYAEVDEAIDDLVQRLNELLESLDAQELERMRVLSQAVELSGHRLTELLEG